MLTQLNSLYLYNNKLTGSLPSELSLLTQLSVLEVNHNELTDSIPSELGLWTQLTSLTLYSNELTGSMPSSLCSADVFFLIDCGEIACTCCRSGVWVGADYPSCPSG